MRRFRARRDAEMLDALIARARPSEAELDRDAMKQVMALAAFARAPINSGAMPTELKVARHGRRVSFTYHPGLTAGGQSRRDQQALSAALQMLSR